MKARILFVVAVSLFTLTFASRPAHAQGTTFTYQGQLSSSGAPANGSFDLRFGLFTNVSTGSQVGNFLTNAAVGVTNGVFTTSLNFSNAFNGTSYFLDIGVRTNGSTGAFTPLTPRQPITPVPYAITASNLTGTLAATQLTGTLPANVVGGAFSNSVSFTNVANVFSGNGSGLTNVPGVTQSNYLYLVDFTTQTLSTSGSYQNVTFSSSGSSGWISSSSSVFAAQQSGLYLVQYRAHVQNNNASSAITVAARCILNLVAGATEISGSESIASVPAGFAVNILSHSFLVQINAGQTLSLQAVNNTSGTTTLVSGSFEGQTFPSVTLTAVRIQ